MARDLPFEEIHPDPWLSEMIRKPCYSFKFSARFPENISRPESDSLKQFLREDIFAFVKIPVENIGAVSSFEALGFRLVDTNVTFRRPYSGVSPSYSSSAFAAPHDEEAVAQIARESFVFSRFHLDPMFPKELASKMKEEWVRNFFRGKRGDNMVVAKNNNETVVGFNQILKTDDQFIIDLIAVSPSAQGEGFAADMIHFAAASIPHKSILVGTQVANRASIRLYEKLGFRLESASYVMHYSRPNV